MRINVDCALFRLLSINSSKKAITIKIENNIYCFTKDVYLELAQSDIYLTKLTLIIAYSMCLS